LPALLQGPGFRTEQVEGLIGVDSRDSVEAERQVTEAADRYREVVRSMEAGGRPEIGQQAAVKAVGRAIQLIAFVLKRAAAAGSTPERLGELTGWEPELVRELLERPPEPALVVRVTPPGVDPGEIARAAASVEAAQRLHALAGDMLADIDDDAWSPAAADLGELHDQVESVWHAWRQALGRQPPERRRRA
jgi:hypothetical protein